MAILGELDRAGLIDTSTGTVHSKSLGRSAWSDGTCGGPTTRRCKEFYRAAPGGVPTQVAFSQDRRYDSLDLDREKGVIRDVEHAYSKDGGLAVLYGNLAEDGCIVKTAGVDESILTFSGPARVYESQDAAVNGILGGEVKPGDVVVIRYEGPRGGPGMQEMLYPDQLPQGERARQSVRPDHRRAVFGRHVGAFDRPRLAGSSRRRHDRAGRGRRHHRDRHPQPPDPSRRRRRRARKDAGRRKTRRDGGPRSPASAK